MRKTYPYIISALLFALSIYLLSLSLQLIVLIGFSSIVFISLLGLIQWLKPQPDQAPLIKLGLFVVKFLFHGALFIFVIKFLKPTALTLSCIILLLHYFAQTYILGRQLIRI